MATGWLTLDELLTGAHIAEGGAVRAKGMAGTLEERGKVVTKCKLKGTRPKERRGKVRWAKWAHLTIVLGSTPQAGGGRILRGNSLTKTIRKPHIGLIGEGLQAGETMKKGQNHVKVAKENGGGKFLTQDACQGHVAKYVSNY